MPRSGRFKRDPLPTAAAPADGSDLKSDQDVQRVVENVEFAHGVLPDLEFSALTVALVAGDDSHQCTQLEWDAVAAVLADRLIDNLIQLKQQGGNCGEWPRLQAALRADMDWLAGLLGEEFDDRTITALAAALRRTSGERRSLLQQSSHVPG